MQIYAQIDDIKSQLTVTSQIIESQIPAEQAVHGGQGIPIVFHPVVLAFPLLDKVILVNVNAPTVDDLHNWAESNRFDPATMQAQQQLLIAAPPTSAPSVSVAPPPPVITMQSTTVASTVKEQVHAVAPPQDVTVTTGPTSSSVTSSFQSASSGVIAPGDDKIDNIAAPSTSMAGAPTSQDTDAGKR